jgi:Tfp pilus assembly protein PilO
MLFREKQQLTIFVVAVVIIGGFVLFRYRPLSREKRAVEQNIFAQRLTIAKGAADGKQLPVLKQQLQKVRSELENYEANIPDQRALGVFLRRIAALMNEHNLYDQNIEPREEVKNEEFYCIPMSMRCKGKLSQLFEFYKQLQGLDRLIRIERVKLTNDKDFSGEVRMETEAVIYYKAQFGQG